jgi:hypothetical protein
MASEPPPPPPAAWRLTFQYEGEDVHVVSQERVEMLAPPDDEELLRQGDAGYWVEVRDDHGSVLYRQVVHDPIRTDLEVFPEDPSQPIERVEVERPQGVFQVVVPDLPDGSEAVLQGQTSRQELRSQAARPLVATRLGDAGKGKAG